jgi:hypothetical protein
VRVTLYPISKLNSSAHTLIILYLISLSRYSLRTYTYTFLFGDRIGTVHPRGPLAPHQKGGCSAQAPRDEQEGQGFQIPLDPDRVAYPSPRSLLQNEAADPTDLQVRFGDGVDPCGMIVMV